MTTRYALRLAALGYLAAAVDEIGGDSHVLTIDRESSRSRSPNVYELLERCSLTHRATPVFAESSFTWELMKMLEQDPRPQFDFVYLDAGHTWDVTGYAFFLVDLLLAPGGWLLFDDLDWTLGGSKHMRKQPWVNELPEEQRSTAQVRKVFELLVRTHPDYVDIHEQSGWGWARKRVT
jgi:predicted O-methyltransferase YrrM